MNSTTKKLLIFGGIVAVIIIFIALKKKQDEEKESGNEEKESGEGEAKLPSLGLVPSSLVGILPVPGSEDNTDDEIEPGSQSLVTATVSKQPGTTKGNQYMSQIRNVRGKNFFDGMKMC